MQNNAKVSIIVPVYNTDDYLPQCLESLVNQTFGDIEIICVDDGSTDNSLNILKEYAAKDKRIVIFSGTNRGPGGARNIGLSLAKSEYIMFVDSDDYVDEKMVEIFFNKITENEVDLVISHLSCIPLTDNMQEKCDDFGRYYENCRKKEGVYDLKKINELRSGPVAKLFKRSIITSTNLKFPERIIQEDEAWNWFYLSQIKKYYFIEDSYYYRIVREDSIMGRRDLTKIGAKDMLVALEHIYKYLNKHGLYNKFHRQYCDYFNSHTRSVHYRVAEHDKEKVHKTISKMAKKHKIVDHVSFIQQIFSIRNERNHKVIRILGFKIKIKRNKKIKV